MAKRRAPRNVPPRITAIVASARHRQRASIKVDAKTVATLNYALIDELGLCVELSWDDAVAQRVAEAVAFEKAWRTAMRRLERRALSWRQVIDKLKTRGFEPTVIDRVVYSGQVLKHNPTGTKVEVSHIGVAHLTGQQANRLTAGSQPGVRILIKQAVEYGRMRQGYSIVVPLGAKAQSVNYHQYQSDRLHLHG